jgi:hypothetical protein
MKKTILAIAFSLLFSQLANAATERTIKLNEIYIEDIKIEGRIQTWILQKLCIEGQAYLLIAGVTGPNGISPSFKDGKPEQCNINHKHP